MAFENFIEVQSRIISRQKEDARVKQLVLPVIILRYSKRLVKALEHVIMDQPSAVVQLWSGIPNLRRSAESRFSARAHLPNTSTPLETSPWNCHQNYAWRAS